MENAISRQSQTVPLIDGSTVQLPAGRFPAPSVEMVSLYATKPNIAALRYARDASIVDADGIPLRLSVFVANRWLKEGNTSSGPEITPVTANLDGYLRARAVFAHPERFAPEYTEHAQTCDSCGKSGPGYIILAPDAMCNPSEVGFVCIACK
jgi:hypothetical protein